MNNRDANRSRNFTGVYPERIRQKAPALDCQAEGEALFEYVYPIATADQQVQSRVDGFLNLYGFARNMSLAFLLAALGILVAHYLKSNDPSSAAEPGSLPQLRWALFAGVLGVILFYRYLKFFRQYSYELLLRYSGPARPEAGD